MSERTNPAADEVLVAVMDALGQPERRVLAAICLLGPQRSATRALALVTGLSTGQVVRALEILKGLDAISRTRWSTPATSDTEHPATWWPTPAWHALLGLAMDIAELAGGADERLHAMGQAIPHNHKEGVPA